MYLKCHKRFKDGKDHRYWSIVESVRTRRGVIKRQLLYLGEINDSQRAQWCSALDVLNESGDTVKQMSLFPEDRTPPPIKCLGFCSNRFWNQGKARLCLGASTVQFCSNRFWNQGKAQVSLVPRPRLL